MLSIEISLADEPDDMSVTRDLRTHTQTIRTAFGTFARNEPAMASLAYACHTYISDFDVVVRAKVAQNLYSLSP